MEAKEVPVNCCTSCPCYYVDISEVGHPPEHKCNLLDRQIYCWMDNEVDLGCPLKTNDHVLVLRED
jgi:hypothetical protein